MACCLGLRAPAHNVGEIGEMLLRFAATMQGELNANAHKGDWYAWWPTVPCLFGEIEHHLTKLRRAVNATDAYAITENAADCANLLMKLAEVHGGPLYAGVPASTARAAKEFEDFKLQAAEDMSLVLERALRAEAAIKTLDGVRESAFKEAAQLVCPLCAGANRFVGAVPERGQVVDTDYLHRFLDTGGIAAICSASALYVRAAAPVEDEVPR